MASHHNYNTLMALISGLNVAAVQRLKLSWQKVSRRTLLSLRSLEQAMSPESNYAAYRDRKSKHVRPAVPFVGLTLKDLTFLNDGNPRWVEATPDGDDSETSAATSAAATTATGSDRSAAGTQRLVNFDKLQRVYDAIQEVASYAEEPYAFAADDALQALLSARQLKNLDDAALYKYSLLCEPREGKATQASVRLIEKWMEAGGVVVDETDFSSADGAEDGS